MEVLSWIWHYGVVFLLVLSILVFVHEFGHYWVARRVGVKVESFSIGFGPELWGHTDRSGTRWKLSAIPLGGYVKMFGDADASSRPGAMAEGLSEAERAQSFHHKPVGARAAVVAAGPAANFLFAILVLATLFMVAGQPYTPPVVSGVQAGGPAERAGIMPGDRILELGGRSIHGFEDLVQVIGVNAGQPLTTLVLRNGQELSLVVTPEWMEREDRFGNKFRTGRLGIEGSGPYEYKHHGPASAIWTATRETVFLSGAILQSIWQIIAGERNTDELGGIIRIGKMSGDIAQLGARELLWFMALLSINLGLINLLPIPVLDGGHLVFYTLEAVRGRPLGERAQEYGFRIGLALVLSLAVFATWNDLVYLRVGEFFAGLLS